MPLITITTTTDYQPANTPEEDTERQAIVARLGESFPEMIVSNCKQLRLDPADTPIEGVQVDYQQFHRRGINTVKVWVKVEFAEEPPPPDQQTEVREVLEALTMGWMQQFCPARSFPETMALDTFWGPDRGFLAQGPTNIIRW